MTLSNTYFDLMRSIGFAPNQIEILWGALEKAYTGKSRHYHNLNHLTAMTQDYERHFESLQKPKEVLFSIFYHDLVYKASQKDNELQSANQALKILFENKNLDKTLVYDHICATKTHLHSSNQDTNWLLDFDLKILASPPETYQNYCQQIRQEYKIYPDFLYKPGRKKALEHFLEQAFIYQTDFFRNQYEQQARNNIKNEIATL